MVKKNVGIGAILYGRNYFKIFFAQVVVKLLRCVLFSGFGLWVLHMLVACGESLWFANRGEVGWYGCGATFVVFYQPRRGEAGSVVTCLTEV